MRPILLSVPHASRRIPEEVLPYITFGDADLEGYIDLCTDQIYDVENVHTIMGEVCRVFVDVNRAPDDIAREYEKGQDGVIVHVTQDGKPIYHQLPSDELVQLLIQRYHDPYHEKIDAVMGNLHFLFDCHSYAPIGPPMKKDAGQVRPDFNIGNLRYSTCNRQHTLFVRDFFQERGYTVGINTPYAGGYVLAHHCHRRRIPTFLVPGMQIEISQGLYLDSDTLAPLPGGIEKARTIIRDLMDAFAGYFLMEKE